MVICFFQPWLFNLMITTPESYLNALTKLINDDGLYYEYVFQKQTDEQLRIILPFIFNNKLNDPVLDDNFKPHSIENISFMIKDNNSNLLALVCTSILEFNNKKYLDYFGFSPTSSRKFFKHIDTLGPIMCLEICKNFINKNIDNSKSINGFSWRFYNKKFNRSIKKYWSTPIFSENYAPNKKLNITQEELDIIYSTENKLKFDYKMPELNSGIPQFNSETFFLLEFLA